jgi:hypothetical protein
MTSLLGMGLSYFCASRFAWGSLILPFRGILLVTFWGEVDIAETAAGLVYARIDKDVDGK